MSKAMFDRDVDFKLENTENPYAACRALSLRAREFNTSHKPDFVETTEEEHSPNPTAVALADYAEGRIALVENPKED